MSDYEELQQIIFSNVGDKLLAILTLEGAQSEEISDFWLPEEAAFAGYCVGKNQTRDVSWRVTEEGYFDEPLNLALIA